MSWTSSVPSSPAVTVVDDYTSPPVGYEFTSCSTVLLRGTDTWKMRMYGVNLGQNLQTTGDRGEVFVAAPACDFTSPFLQHYPDGAGLDTQQYIESASWSARGGFTGTFALNKNVDSIYNTCVPREVGLMALTRYRLVGVGSAGVAVPEDDTRCGVKYKDPHVLKLPDDQGWLMVLGRYITEGNESPDQTNSISQIVGWWSATEDFTGLYVVGPLLLVDAARCLAVDQGVRLWVGVPAAVALAAEDGDGYDLFVYYAVDECGIGYSSPSTVAGKLGRSTTPFADRISPSAYQAELSRLEFSAGVAVKRLSLSFLMDTIKSELSRVLTIGSSARLATNEDLWAPDFALSGDLLGQVRLWILDALPYAAPGLRAFDTYYPLEALRPADPTPVTCRGSGGLSLFVAMIGGEVGDIEPADASAGTLGSGHGLWRASALGGGNPYYDADNAVWFLTTTGKDFLVRSPLGTSDLKSVDQIAESDGCNFNYDTATKYFFVSWLDPDPVQLDDGSWWVAAGAEAELAGPYMSVFKGTRFDVCEYTPLSTGAGPGPGLALPGPPAVDAPGLRPRPQTYILPSPQLR